MLGWLAGREMGPLWAARAGTGKGAGTGSGAALLSPPSSFLSQTQNRTRATTLRQGAFLPLTGSGCPRQNIRSWDPLALFAAQEHEGLEKEVAAAQWSPSAPAHPKLCPTPLDTALLGSQVYQSPMKSSSRRSTPRWE